MVSRHVLCKCLGGLGRRVRTGFNVDKCMKAFFDEAAPYPCAAVAAKCCIRRGMSFEEATVLQ